MRLKEVRARKLYSIRGLGEAAGVSPSTVRNIEARRYLPRLDVVRKLAAALEVEAEQVDEFRASIEAAARGRPSRRQNTTEG